ncbi:MAG: ATP-binding protein, partial [Methanosarcinaceae archaeon]|nr:ATP-binding protein [Methanosarcinaceae archaeon]
MANDPYILDELLLSGFRAFLVPQRFDFRTKRCLAVFAPNGSGKSSIVDALEFMFSEDGTLERLGVRATNNQAGITALAHNLADEKDIHPFVRVRFKRGNEKPEGMRIALGSARTPRPAIADAVSACFTVNPLIRGHALRRFVEEQTAEERYEDVAHWLQLGPLVDVQRNLRALRQRTKAAAEDRNALKRVDIQLKRKSANAVTTWDEEAVLVYANSILPPLDEALSLKSLDRTDPAFITVQDRAKAEETQLGLEGLRQVRRTAAVLYEEKEDPDTGGPRKTGLLPDFAAAVDVRVMAEETEAAERNAAANTVFDEFWKVAEPLFAEGKPVLDTCPVCKTPIADSTAGSVEGVRQHIAANRAELANYAKAKKGLEEASADVVKIRTELIAALKALKPLLAEEHAAFQATLADYLDSAKCWDGGAVPDATSLKTSLHELTTALDASIKTIEAKQGENTYIKVLSKVEEMIEFKDERERAVCLLAELEKLSAALNTQAVHISSAIRKKVQAL